MSITLSDGATTLTLNQLLWSDRNRTMAVGREQMTLGGSMHIQRMSVSAGTEIVLDARLSGGSLRGWFVWGQVGQLRSWRDAATVLTLVYDSDSRTVIIPLDGIDITPIKDQSITITDTALCAGSLTLFEV